MALDRTGISRAREGADNLKSFATSLETAGTELSNIIKADGNYQFFRTGTDKGFDVDDNLNDVVNIVVTQLKPQISALSAAIHTFCNNQEALNRLEEMRKARESGEASTGTSVGNGVNNHDIGVPEQPSAPKKPISSPGYGGYSFD